jgi:hypothetical protein
VRPDRVARPLRFISPRQPDVLACPPCVLLSKIPSPVSPYMASSETPPTPLQLSRGERRIRLRSLTA